MEKYERFWAKVDRRGPDECWPWTGAKYRKGYGQWHLRGKRFVAHRLSYEIANGPIPSGMMICHHCDNPPCVNPAHLYAGTAQTNSDDKYARGRGILGKPRPDTEARLRREMVARNDGIWADPEDVAWWTNEGYASGMQAARAHAERVIRGDGLDTNCRWLSLDA